MATQQNQPPEATSAKTPAKQGAQEVKIEGSREPRRALERMAPSRSRAIGGFAQSPFSMMRRLMEDMERMTIEPLLGRGLLPELFGEEEPFGRSLDRALWSPDIDVVELENELVVRADVPGISPEEIRVEIIDNNLILEGERAYEREERPRGGYRMERAYGAFRRMIPLPEGLDAESARAQVRNGVLEVAFKLPERSRRKRIDVQKAEEGSAGTQGATGTQGSESQTKH